MNSLEERGSTMFMVSFVITAFLLVSMTGFGIWAFLGRQEYKNDVDKKIAAAVEVAKKETSTSKDNDFLEREKEPLKSYLGPAPYGSVSVQYPKTWGAYVEESDSGSTPINGYFHPGYVPAAEDSNSFALRLEITNRAYDVELQQFENAVKNGAATVQVYTSPASATAIGSRVDGEVANKKRGAMILIPLRDKTLKLWTESEQFVTDFNNLILPNLTFIP